MLCERRVDGRRRESGHGPRLAGRQVERQRWRSVQNNPEIALLPIFDDDPIAEHYRIALDPKITVAKEFVTERLAAALPSPLRVIRSALP